MKKEHEVIHEMMLYQKDVDYLKDMIDRYGSSEVWESKLELYQNCVAMLKWVLK
jgi:hypothetical protein